MASIKMKGVFKGFNKKITHIFVREDDDEEEMEIEIGCPMDVQHVGHIGWDGSTGDSAPKWMDDMKTGPQFASSSIGRDSARVSAWSPDECASVNEDAAGQKKHRRKKVKKSTSCTTSPRGDDTASAKKSLRAKTKKIKAKLANEL